MLARTLAAAIGRHVLPFRNRRVVSPPGKLEPAIGRLVIVPTIMRSGTHLLIDTILNNFSGFRRNPLYVDLDRLLDDPIHREERIAALLQAGNYVVKTHYPQVRSCPARDRFMNEVIAGSIVVTVTRHPDDTLRSSRKMGLPIACEELEYGRSIDRFKEYWAEFPWTEFEFAELVSREKYRGVIASLEHQLGEKSVTTIKYPIPDSRRLSVYMMKGLTRLVGKYSPLINTTITFSRTEKR